MKKCFASVFLCFAIVSVEFPAGGQTTSQPKLSAARLRALNEKLLSTLTGRQGHCELADVQSLIQQGASPNAKNWDGNILTAFMLTAQNGCADIVRLLLDAGADVHVLTGCRATVMAFATT